MRDYLDSIGQYETKIMLMSPPQNEVQQTIGFDVARMLKRRFKEKRISVIHDAKVRRMQGEDKVKRIVFVNPDNKEEDVYVDPDLVVIN